MKRTSIATLLALAVLAGPAFGKPGEDKGKNKDKDKGKTEDVRHHDHDDDGRDHDDDHDDEGTMRFLGMDTNNDGRITRAEWRGNDVSFANHDWNDDGVLSGEEVRPGGSRDDDDDDGLPSSRFDRLDSNHDGVLSRAEWPGRTDDFNRLDRNNDNFVSRAEFENPVLPGPREGRFDSLDANRDGRLSRGEWRGGDDVFNGLDANHDGFVTRSEFLNPPAGMSRLQRFTTWDHNDDGVLTRSEWHADTSAFNRLDDDYDGLVSLAEYLRG